jgi:RNA polymerase sigma-70 factor (ECF subfamily)
MTQDVTEEQIRGVYRDTIDALYARVARRCAGDRELTEDVVQETWMRAVHDWRIHGLPTIPLAWLTTVSRNLLLNEFRRRRPVPLDDVSTAELTTAATRNPDNAVEAASDTLANALERLPNAQSRLLRAFHLDGQKVSRIARAMGISERAVEGRLRRARRNLRKEIDFELPPCSTEET